MKNYQTDFKLKVVKSFMAGVVLKYALRLIVTVGCSMVFFYMFAAATGYVSWVPNFGHADLGLLGWLVMLLFLPFAYGVSFLTNENPPPYYQLGLVLAIVGAVCMWLLIARLQRRGDRSSPPS